MRAASCSQNDGKEKAEAMVDRSRGSRAFEKSRRKGMERKGKEGRGEGGKEERGAKGRVRSGLAAGGLYLRVLDRRPVLFYESQYFTRQLDSRGGHR